MLGNPLVGKAMAALHIKTPAITSKFGWGSSSLLPTSYTRGRMMSAATVWLMNVAMTKIKDEKTTRIAYRLSSCTRTVMASVTVCRRPDELTALPRDRPPAARMMIVQGKLLKSSFVRIPTPKKRTIGMMAMTPMSPKTFSS